MENIAITSATPKELRSGELGRKLRHCNYRFVGEYLELHVIRLNAGDGDGRLLGGLATYIVDSETLAKLGAARWSEEFHALPGQPCFVLQRLAALKTIVRRPPWGV